MRWPSPDAGTIALLNSGASSSTLRAAVKRSIAESIQRVKIDPDTGEPTEVILPDRLAAGTLLMRSLGGLIDRQEVSGPNGGPVEIGPAQLAQLDDSELEMLQQLTLGHGSYLVISCRRWGGRTMAADDPKPTFGRVSSCKHQTHNCGRVTDMPRSALRTAGAARMSNLARRDIDDHLGEIVRALGRFSRHGACRR